MVVAHEYAPMQTVCQSRLWKWKYKWKECAMVREFEELSENEGERMREDGNGD
jgi:hypothetical protein